jgi:hypothetical protein
MRRVQAAARPVRAISVLALSLAAPVAAAGCAVDPQSEVGVGEAGPDAGLEVIELALEPECTTSCPPFATGIYVLTFGQSLADADMNKAASSPNVTGVVLRIPWAKVQPDPPLAGQPATYDWSELEKQLDLVPTGKRVGLAITPGTKSPAWFCGNYPGQCKTFSYTPGGPVGGSVITVPKPFSTEFETVYGNMIAALGARLQSRAARYAKIAYVKLDGVNMTTDETRLPLTDASGATINWGVSDPTAAAIDAFKRFAGKWARAFGSKRLSLAAVGDLSTRLRDWMKSTFATRGIVQANGLKDGANLSSTVTGAMTGTPHTLGGWQPWNSIQQGGCGMWGANACEPTSCSSSSLYKVFRGMVKFGMGLCPGQTTPPGSFFEMYKEDILAYDVVQADNVNYVKSSQALIKANAPPN